MGPLTLVVQVRFLRHCCQFLRRKGILRKHRAPSAPKNLSSDLFEKLCAAILILVIAPYDLAEEDSVVRKRTSMRNAHKPQLLRIGQMSHQPNWKRFKVGTERRQCPRQHGHGVVHAREL